MTLEHYHKQAQTEPAFNRPMFNVFFSLVLKFKQHLSANWSKIYTQNITEGLIRTQTKLVILLMLIYCSVLHFTNAKHSSATTTILNCISNVSLHYLNTIHITTQLTTNMHPKY